MADGGRHEPDEADVGMRQQVRSRSVGRRRRIDPDDLLSPPEVAERIGLANPDALSVYQARYDDFPAPVIDKGRYIKLWLIGDVDAFLKRHPRIGRKARDDKPSPS